jgi:ATP-dependent exoDNAse (exonuclease V) alpha subunit
MPKKEKIKAEPQQVQTLVLPKNFEISPEMQAAITAVSNGKSIFITGRAGTGKSTLLTYLREEILKDNFVVVAPTGVAAINVGGSTIHKFFGFLPDITFQHIESAEYHPRSQKIIKNLKTLIIDEISMVRADLLDCVDKALRKFGSKPTKPFGGVQVIFVGDLYQLSPIVSESEKEFLYSHYETPFFFSSHGYKSIQMHKVVLNKVYRQSELDFLEILNGIRVNQTTPEILELLNTRVLPEFEPSKDTFFITLVATNSMANTINQRELEKLKGDAYRSQAHITGALSKSEYPAELEISFKVGSQIMMLNNDAESRWVNGTLATIEAINLDDPRKDPHIVIKVASSEERYDVSKHLWDIKRPRSEGNVLIYDTIGTFSQFPFMLAWAITIHKSQGKTFENVIINLAAKAFAAGQLYVALSRCTTLGGLVLRQPIDSSQVILDERVMDFHLDDKG